MSCYRNGRRVLRNFGLIIIILFFKKFPKLGVYVNLNLHNIIILKLLVLLLQIFAILIFWNYQRSQQSVNIDKPGKLGVRY